MDATANFERTLAAHEVGPLVRGPTTTLQVNVGKRCNQACHHCHVEAGPRRTEGMGAAVAPPRLGPPPPPPPVAGVHLAGGGPPPFPPPPPRPAPAGPPPA